MFRISGRDHGPPRQRDAGNLSVANIDGPPLQLALGCKHGRCFGSGEIERHNPSLQVLLKEPEKGLFEFCTPTSLRHRQ